MSCLNVTSCSVWTAFLFRALLVSFLLCFLRADRLKDRAQMPVGLEDYRFSWITVLSRNLKSSVNMQGTLMENHFLDVGSLVAAKKSSSLKTNIFVHEESSIGVMFLPVLDHAENCAATDLQWLSLAATLSDHLMYLVSDNIFTPDVRNIELLMTHHTLPLHDPNSKQLKSVLVMLDSNRSFTIDEKLSSPANNSIWSPIYKLSSLPRALPVTCTESVSFTSFMQMVSRYPRSHYRSVSQFMAYSKLQLTRIFSDANKNYMQQLMIEHSSLQRSSRRVSDVEVRVRKRLEPFLELDSATGADVNHNWALTRFAEICLELETECATLSSPLVRERMQSEIELYRSKHKLKLAQWQYERSLKRDQGLDTALQVYTMYSVATAQNESFALPLECSLSDNNGDGLHGSPLGCALYVVKSVLQLDLETRATVVDDLIFSDKLCHDYALFEGVKNAAVAGNVYLRFSKSLSLLLDAGYSKSEVVDMLSSEIVTAAANMRLDDISAAKLKRQFLDAATLHFASPPPVRYIHLEIGYDKNARRKGIIRMAASAVVSVALVTFMPGAVGSVLPSLSGMSTAVLTGAASGAAGGLITKQKDGDLLNSVIRGALLAGAANAIGDAFPFAEMAKGSSHATFSLSNAVLRAGAEAGVGCTVSELTGGKCKHGLLQGAIGEVASTARVGLGIESKVVSALFAGSASATTAWATGGNWVEGFVHGAIIDQLNHAMHGLKSKLEQQDQSASVAAEIKEKVVVFGDESVGTGDGSIILFEKTAAELAKEGPNAKQRIRLISKYAAAAGLGAVDYVVDFVTGSVTVVFHAATASPLDITVGATKALINREEIFDQIGKMVSSAANTLVSDKSFATPENFRVWTKTFMEAATIAWPAAKMGKAQLLNAGKTGHSAATTMPFFLETMPVHTVDVTVWGAVGERNGVAIYKSQGWTILEGKSSLNGNGLDIFASRAVPGRGVNEYFFGEVKTTSKTLADASKVYLPNTRNGKCMSVEWTLKKLKDLNNPQLVQDIQKSMDAGYMPHRELYRPTVDNALNFENHLLPKFDMMEFRNGLNELLLKQ